jgi:hypothetical protein
MFISFLKVYSDNECNFEFLCLPALSTDQGALMWLHHANCRQKDSSLKCLLSLYVLDIFKMNVHISKLLIGKWQ